MKSAVYKESKKQYADTVAESIIALLKDGVAPWQRPWQENELQRPYNGITNKHYNGNNVISLTITSMQKGYSDPRWYTFLQAKTEGYNVRKGEKASLISYSEYFRIIKEHDPSTGEDIEKKIPNPKPFIKYHYVFNAQQLDGIVPLPSLANSNTNFTPNQKAEELIENVIKNGKCIVYEEGNKAYYNCNDDIIRIPNKLQFINESMYYTTLLHEIGHWTGHENRLNRNIKNVFGTNDYAKEELRAEIASMMISMDTGISFEPRHSAAYVQSWIKVLENDHTEIFKASADAEKIAFYITNGCRKLEYNIAPDNVSQVAEPRIPDRGIGY